MIAVKDRDTEEFAERSTPKAFDSTLRENCFRRIACELKAIVGVGVDPDIG
jgi:hypothetical protein